MNYLKQVSKKEILHFLEKNGYSIVEPYHNSQGELLLPFRREYDKDTNEYCYVVICTKTDSIYDKINKYNLPFFKDYIYDCSKNMLIISNFNIQFITIENDDFDTSTIVNNFVKFMYKKFGEAYRTDYNKFVTDYNAHLLNGQENNTETVIN